MAEWRSGEMVQYEIVQCEMVQWHSGVVAKWRNYAVAKWRSVKVAEWRNGAVAQWLELWTWILCCRFFTLYFSGNS